MEPKKLLADTARQFLKDKKINRYRTKYVADMTEDEVISCCHCYCEENGLVAEWNVYREKTEAEYRYCSYLEQYVEAGLCYDLQMLADGLIKQSALSEINIDKEACTKHCITCKHSL